jgi:hypothetical protein
MDFTLAMMFISPCAEDTEEIPPNGDEPSRPPPHFSQLTGPSHPDHEVAGPEVGCGIDNA